MSEFAVEIIVEKDLLEKDKTACVDEHEDKNHVVAFLQTAFNGDFEDFQDEVNEIKGI